MAINYRAEAEKHLATAARHLIEFPADMRIAEVAAWIGQGYATLALLAAPQGPATEIGRRFRITPQHLEAVTKVYKAAHQEGRSPTQAVADHFGTGHSTAAKWVGAARRNGHLPPANPGKAGA